MHPCSRSAVQVGRNSAPMVLGSMRSKMPASPQHRSFPRTPVSLFLGPTSSSCASKERRSSASPFLSLMLRHAAKPSSRRVGSKAARFYAVIPHIRTALAAHGSATLSVDLKPDLDTAALTERLSRRRPQGNTDKLSAQGGASRSRRHCLASRRCNSDPRQLRSPCRAHQSPPDPNHGADRPR